MDTLSTTSDGPLPKILLLQNIPLFLSGLLCLLLLKIVATAIYNVHFHPLSKYPGPLSAAASNFPYWYYACTGDLAEWNRNLHTQYGEVVRIGPDKLTYVHPQAWKDIYGHRVGGKKANIKEKAFYKKEYNGHDTLATLQDDTEHSRTRRIFSHAFSDKALKEQEPLFIRHVKKLVANVRRQISEDPNAELDAVKLYNCTTFDIMGDLTFGEPLGLLDNSNYSPWVSAVFGGIKAGHMTRILLDNPLLLKIVKALLPRHLADMEKMHFQHSVDRVDRRMEKGNDKPDIWNLVLQKPEGKGLNLGDMYANSSLFMLAGTETTATLLSGLTYQLLKNPDKMQKLVQEIRGSFASEEELTIENLHRLRYMTACFEEGFRCYPPVPMGLPREVTEGGNIICGEWVPAKTRVSIYQWSAYHYPLNFKWPNAFIPERWLPGTGFDEDRKEAVQPFSVGPRNCLGKNLAYHEMRVILAEMLWHFDLELCAQSGSWADQKSYTLWEKPPLMVRAKAVQ